MLTPGSPGGGGGVGVTGGFTLPVMTCWTVLTVVRMVGPERGCSHARNWSRTLARIDRRSHASQTWWKLNASQPPFVSARVTVFFRS